MLATEFDPILALDNPYVGLRPFESYESLLFFGREAHTRELVERLGQSRFLAVIGSSGSGKSSLVRAGLLPVLQRGYLVGTSSRWRIAIMRPGSAPLQELTQALAAKEVFDSKDPAPLRELLGRSSYGLVNAVRNAKLRAGENLLLVVDQFEELFRFAKENRHPASKAEAALFVSLLIEATEAFDEPIYVVLTMRSEFLGYCTHFPGLAEALNRSQYLIPRLTLNQRQATIERPVALTAADVSPALVQRLLTDAGDDPDQLPVLQHALMRTFDHSKRDGEPRVLSLDDYEEVSKTGSALDQHATELYDSLPNATQVWAERLFRCITTTIDGSAVRRPARLRWIYAVTGARTADERAQVSQVIELYSARENSLLFSTTGKALGPRSIIDISHESLIRKWKLLGEWVSTEARSAEWLRDVASCVKRKADYTEDPDLSYIENLQRSDNWNSAWAAQYIPKREVRYARICEFLVASRQAQDEAKRHEEERQRRELETAQQLARQEQERRRLLEQKRRMGLFALTMMAAAVVGLSYAAMRFYQERNRADQAAQVALDQRAIADQAKIQARVAENEANKRATEVALLTARGADRAQLEKELSDYKRQAEALVKTAKEAPAVKATTDDWAAAQIRGLQDEVAVLKGRLNQAARVRDLKLDVQQQAPAPDSGEREVAQFRDRINRLESENTRLLTTLSQQQQQLLLRPVQNSAPVPAFYPVIVPQNSWFVHPPANPKFGIILEDLRRRGSATARMFVFALPNALEPKAAVIDKESIVAPKVNELSASHPCPSLPGKDGVACFLVRKKDATRDIQTLGALPIGQTSFTFYAMGWQQNATGTDVLSVAVAAEPGAVQAKPVETVATGKWKADTDEQPTRIHRAGEGILLHLAELSTGNVASVAVIATTQANLLTPKSVSAKQYISQLKEVKGSMEPDTYFRCEIKKGQTCWVTLPGGKTLGVKADDLAYTSGRAEFSLFTSAP